MAEEKKERISVVTKKIEFLVNTGNYNNVKIGTETQETITWKTKKERDEKTASIFDMIAIEAKRELDKTLKTFYGKATTVGDLTKLVDTISVVPLIDIPLITPTPSLASSPVPKKIEKPAFEQKKSVKNALDDDPVTKMVDDVMKKIHTGNQPNPDGEVNLSDILDITQNKVGEISYSDLASKNKKEAIKGGDKSNPAITPLTMNMDISLEVDGKK